MTSTQAANTAAGTDNVVGASGSSYWEHPSNATSRTTTQSAPPANGDGDPTAHLIGRTSIALITVVGIILVCAWALKRLGMGRTRVGQGLPIVASRSLGQRERIVVIEVEDEWLVLGVTSHQINTLHRLPAPPDRASADDGTDAATASHRFGQVLSENISRLTGRRSS